MKSYNLIAPIILVCSVLASAQTTAPAVPAVLEPLKATIAKTPGGKGDSLSFQTDKPLTDEQWKAVDSLGLHVFSVGGKGIDDAALAHLAKLNPEGISFNGASFTDDGCKALAEMKSLHKLAIYHTPNQFTGTGLAQLKAIPSLEALTFAGSNAGDAAMEAIGELSQIKNLATWHTHRTQAGNASLLKLHLISLNVGNSLPGPKNKPRELALDDSTIPTLAKLETLQNLTLTQARLSLSALTQLKALPKLKTLTLTTVDIDPANVTKLGAALPGVKITCKPLTDADRKTLDAFLGTAKPESK